MVDRDMFGHRQAPPELEQQDADDSLILLVCFIVASCSVYLCCCTACCTRCFVCRWLGCPWFGKRQAAQNGDAPPRIEVVDGDLLGNDPALISHVRRGKSVGTAYLLLLTAGIFGAHHFYLERVMHGVLAIFTLNFLGLGWSIDVLAMPLYVRWANGGVAAFAPLDAPAWPLLCRLPVIAVVAFVAISSLVQRTPMLLNDIGVVDLDIRLAGTSANPYDLLRVQRGAPKKAVMKAQEQRLKEAQGSPECKAKPGGSACKGMQEDFSSAASYIIYGPSKESPSSARRKDSWRDRRKARKEADADDKPDKMSQEWGALFNATKEAFEWAIYNISDIFTFDE